VTTVTLPMTCRASVAAATILIAVLALAPSAARAATVSIDGDTITFTDTKGEINSLDVSRTGVDCPDDSDRCIEFYDLATDPDSADPRCAGFRSTLTCAVPPTLSTIRVNLGPGADRGFSAVGSSDVVTIDGGPGNDRLFSAGANDTLVGGDGDDEIHPEDSPYPGATVSLGPDVVSGGPGIDAVFYWNRSAGVRVSLDGVANDGGPDVDNVLPDVETVWGSTYADILVGSDGDNTINGLAGDDQISGGGGNDQLLGGASQDVIDGGPGNDRLSGGVGDDSLLGGPGVDTFEGDTSSLFDTGNDRIDAVDGVAESISCGTGADSARVDAIDIVAKDPQNSCESLEIVGAAAVAKPPTITPVSPAFARIGAPSSVRRGVVGVKVTCRRAGGCRGRLTLRTAAKVRAGKDARRVLTLGSASFSLRARQSRTVRVKLSRAGRTLLRRGPVRVKAIATSTRPAGPRAERVVVLRQPRR
jgi:RTX calcium-binding nonapeptide repeat (4 copies)